MSGAHPARYKRARGTRDWRALCWWPSCSGQVATLLLIDTAEEELPALRRNTRIAVREDFVKGADGIWRAAKRPPRRPFRSGVAGHSLAGYGVDGWQFSGRGLKILPFDCLPPAVTPVVVACPRCGSLSMVDLTDFAAERTRYWTRRYTRAVAHTSQ